MNFNDNFLYASVFVNTLQLQGLKHAVVSPGSRNTPIIAALDANKKIKKTVILDERSAAFFALGIAKATQEPVLVVTTSGTAAAELYPAIVEAFNSRVPLIACTADRPEIQLFCGENQTINQDNIFANHIKAYFYLKNLEPSLNKLNEIADKAVECYNIANIKNRGPIHINFPFAKPLEPSSFNINFDLKNLAKINYNIVSSKITNLKTNDFNFIESLPSYKRGLIVLGGDYYSPYFYQSIIKISKKLKFFIYPDILSSFILNLYNNSDLVLNNLSFFDSQILQNLFTESDLILQFGKTPINNKILELFKSSKATKILINPYGDLFDPSRTVNQIYSLDYDNFALNALNVIKKIKNKNDDEFIQKIILINKNIEKTKNLEIKKLPITFEGKIIKTISTALNKKAPIMLGNSMPVRYFELFTNASNNQNMVFCNRGASGIDGNNATAAGIAYGLNSPLVFISGDLAFLHDVGSLIYISTLNLPICIIVLDNNGGGIFKLLPISKNQALFDKYFVTPQNQNIKNIAKAFNINYYYVNSNNKLSSYINSFYNNPKPLILHLKTDINNSAEIYSKLKSIFEKISIEYFNAQ